MTQPTFEARHASALAPMTGVAVITGAAGSLGGACAEQLAKRGMSVALIDVDGAGAQRLAERLPNGIAPHLAVETDVTSSDSVREAHRVVTQSLGAPTVVINGAGIAVSSRIDEITEQEWDNVIAVSVKGMFLVTREFLPTMREQRFGRIVNFSSTAGKSVSTLAGAHYTTAKAAVLGFTRALAAEVGADGITVNAICPGLFDSQMAASLATRDDLMRHASGFPISRLGEPWEVGALVAFLCSSSAGYITGASLDINGGDLMV